MAFASTTISFAAASLSQELNKSIGSAASSLSIIHARHIDGALRQCLLGLPSYIQPYITSSLADLQLGSTIGTINHQIKGAC